MLETVKAHIRARLVGLRTFVGAGAVALVGIAQLAGSVDITPLVHLFVKDQDQVGLVIVVLAVFFGFLRYITTTPVGVIPTNEPVQPPQSAPFMNYGVDAGS